MTEQMITIGYDDGDIDTNTTNNPTLADLVEQRYSRRSALRGGVSAAATFFAGATLASCGSEQADFPTNSNPTASAGAAVSASSGRMVALSGTAGDVYGSVASTVWAQTAGPAVTLTGGNTLTPSFVAPSVAAAQMLTFRLTVTDTTGLTATADQSVAVMPAQLGFAAVAKSLADVLAVPQGYTATVLYRLGDPINVATAAYANNGTDGGFSSRAGDHHDGMSFFGLAASGTAPDRAASTRGLLVLNHENISQAYLHPAGPTTVGGARPQAEAIKEIECHGVSVIEIAQTAGTWAYVPASAFNRRITPLTPTSFSGPVRGNAALRTVYSPTGTTGRGTINNCANGTMPWGDYLTNEENWAGYFRRNAGDDATRVAQNGARTVVALNRYGLAGTRSGNYGWATVVPSNTADTSFARWNITASAAGAADGTRDFRNEANQFGWVVEIDPYDPASTPRKRTALGRMNHEGCWPGRTVAGVRPAFYMGDDAQNEYIYKFVSAAPWVEADAQAANRLATGDKYLDAGTLYVARFNADGTGTWLPLVYGQVPTRRATSTAEVDYVFASQADVLTNARLAGDALGATRMDRPEWTAVNPATGEMYCTLTNNATRTPAGGANPTDASNPRAYTDPKLPQGDQVNVDPPSPPQRTNGNANGHVIRLRETGDTTEATGFTWDIYVFGSGADLDPANINLSGLDATNDFSSCDGLWFGRPSNASGLVTPVLWIETDDGAYTDVTNCMLLAAMPGTVGDGTTRTITNTVTQANGSTATGTQATRLGRAPGTSLRRFLVGPKECEITGIDTTPDGRALFVNIQHPGENGGPANITSNWPANTAGSRPRSATVVITKNDNGVVGL